MDVAFGEVLLAVHAHAKGEQLQQFPTPVLVGGVLVVEVVIQPENHCRVFGQANQKFPEIAQPLLAEQVYLVEHGLFVEDLGQSGGEHTVPQQGNLLLQWPASGIGVHAIDRLGQRSFDVPALFPIDVVPLQHVFFDSRL